MMTLKAHTVTMVIVQVPCRRFLFLSVRIEFWMIAWQRRFVYWVCTNDYGGYVKRKYEIKLVWDRSSSSSILCSGRSPWWYVYHVRKIIVWARSLYSLLYFRSCTTVEPDFHVSIYIYCRRRYIPVSEKRPIFEYGIFKRNVFQMILIFFKYFHYTRLVFFNFILVARVWRNKMESRGDLIRFLVISSTRVFCFPPLNSLLVLYDIRI